MADLDAFLESLSSSAPVPGGGSVAAFETAMGAALLVMVCNLTLGRKRYEAAQTRVEEIRGEAERLRDTAVRLAGEDERAYGEVADVRRLPRDTDEQKSVRGERMQAALKGAIEPPLEAMRVAAAVLRLAGELVEIGNSSAISDVGVAALSARSGFYGASLNVEINLESVSDAEWVNERRREMLGIATPDAQEAAIMSRVGAVIRGEGG